MEGITPPPPSSSREPADPFPARLPFTYTSPMAPTTWPDFTKASIAFCTSPTLTGALSVDAMAGADTLRTNAAHAAETTRAPAD
ncbi:hypothetical protein GCM10007964_65710 [Sphaerisporangium melleum]|uniref:Uncharacterized protein n=1 Tax=Sphaerisporangium melleum TaxID=321316 RepID=A0A917RMF4_9ACTN|nr:hypothetical protein GCM10007964_65710 [Sphaerisporangium melleum]